MAKTDDGKKIVPVAEHKRKRKGGVRRVVSVKRHCRSTPNK